LLAQAIQDVELHLVPNTGHLAFWERASEFVALVSDFLVRQEPAALARP